jgi:hypothetical protein
MESVTRTPFHMQLEGTKEDSLQKMLVTTRFSRGSSVSIVSDYGWTTGPSRFELRQG